MGSCCKRIVVHLPGVDFFGLTGGPRWRRQPGGIGESPRWCRPSGGNSARLGTLVPGGSCCRLAAGARPRADKKIRGGVAARGAAGAVRPWVTPFLHKHCALAVLLAGRVAFWQLGVSDETF